MNEHPEGTVVLLGGQFFRRHGDVWRLLVMSGSMSHAYALEGVVGEVVYSPGAEHG